MGDRIEVVGDDNFVTNRKYIARGIDERTANSALIKLNQIGALSETIRYGCAVKPDGAISFTIAQEAEDDFLANFAVAMGGGDPI